MLHPAFDTFPEASTTHRFPVSREAEPEELLPTTRTPNQQSCHSHDEPGVARSAMRSHDVTGFRCAVLTQEVPEHHQQRISPRAKRVAHVESRRAGVSARTNW